MSYDSEIALDNNISVELGKKAIEGEYNGY